MIRLICTFWFLWLELASANLPRNPLERLDFTAPVNHWGHVLDGYGYIHDPLGLRTNIVRDFGLTNNSVVVGYDSIGQLTSWAARESGGGGRQNEQLGYFFDAAGNLRYRTNGPLVQTFTVDLANELTNITRTGTLTVSGAIPAPATNLTVNGLPADRYGDLTFARTNNLLADGNNTFTNIARNLYGLSATNILAVSLPTNINLTSDSNGNLTNDGIRSFSYDAENQLTNVSVAGSWKTEFVYDGLGRRRIAKDYASQSGQWVKTNETRYVYDGLLPIQERDSNNVALISYTRGLDLSGSLGAAGGIGGLLARSDHSATNAQFAAAYYHADGAGNVTTLMDGYENIVARYLYDPFGRSLGKWGSLADANAMQFSSMPRHARSGLSLYAFRAYDPNLQRWVSQDPVGESGGFDLYRFVLNSPLLWVDPFGLGLHKASSSGYYMPGPLAYYYGDTALQDIGAGALNVLPEVGNIFAQAAQGLGQLLGLAGEGIKEGTKEVAKRTGGNEQDAELLAGGIEAALLFLAPEAAAGIKGFWAKCFKKGSKAAETTALPRTMETVFQHAEQGGVGLEGITVKIVPDAPPSFLGWANPNGAEIHLYPGAFADSETLVTTLGHERMHAYQFQTFGPAVNANTTSAQLFENAAIQSESSFYQYFLSHGGGH